MRQWGRIQVRLVNVRGSGIGRSTALEMGEMSLAPSPSLSRMVEMGYGAAARALPLLLAHADLHVGVIVAAAGGAGLPA